MLHHLDLSNLRSIRAFAGLVLDSEQQLDVLGHFALTGLLLPRLLETPQSRVVTLASLGHWWAKLDFENFNAEKRAALDPRPQATSNNLDAPAVGPESPICGDKPQRFTERLRE